MAVTRQLHAVTRRLHQPLSGGRTPPPDQTAAVAGHRSSMPEASHTLATRTVAVALVCLVPAEIAQPMVNFVDLGCAAFAAVRALTEADLTNVEGALNAWPFVAAALTDRRCSSERKSRRGMWHGTVTVDMWGATWATQGGRAVCRGASNSPCGCAAGRGASNGLLYVVQTHTDAVRETTAVTTPLTRR